MATAAIAAIAVTSAAHAATLVASYQFDNSLASSVGGAPALVLTDPTATSGFVSDNNYFGATRTVLHIGGAATPVTQQGGLTFNSAGLLTHDSYSVALSFKFEDRDGAWRRILDVQNRQSDNGFYVDPSNHLDIFPVAGSVNFTNDTYQNVVLTVGPSGPNNVHAYLQGVGEFTTTTDIMDIANADNPNALINLFLDNVIAGGQGEWSAADIAVANFYDGILSADDVVAFNSNPTGLPGGDGGSGGAGGVPEPGTWALAILGMFGVGSILRRQRMRPRAA
jgi:hypothetical protein